MGNDLLGLLKNGPVVFDGAMGTTLMAAGLPPGDTPELWNEEAPATVADIYRSYYEAGAHVVQTNTFGANPLKLQDRGLGDRVTALNRTAALTAREVCPPGKFVAGDMGPTGKMLAPLGDVSAEELEAGFLVQAEALLAGGVDLLSIETMFSLDEALAALRAARRAGAPLVAAAVTYNRTKNGFFTMMGESLEQCMRALEEEGADVVGTNCTLGSEEMVALTEQIRRLTNRPVLVQPNAGKPESRKGVTVYRQSPEEFARDALAIRAAGADMLGGCCGTTPEFIRAMARALAE